MLDMPRPRKPFIQREITRHGKTVWYFRRGKEQRIRLPGMFGSPEFNAAYDAAANGTPLPVKAAAPRSSLRWLVDQYLDSGRFSRLAVETREMRRRVLLNVCKTGGDLNFRSITMQTIQSGRVRREATPYAAANYVKIMRALFAFAVDSGWRDDNPAEKVAAPMPETDGHHTWTVEEVRRYQEKHALGTQARLAMDLLVYTGLRRGDAVKLGRQHVRNGKIFYRTLKNGVELEIPLLPPLARSIDATKTGDLAFLVNGTGKPWSKEAFGGWFTARCIEAGVPGRAHGLRKAGATFAAENGASPLDLAAMYGWKDPRMAQTYIRKASRAKMAERAANALSPHLEFGAGDVPENETKSMAEK